MLTIETINAINEQYLQRMNEIEAMKLQNETKAQKFARQARDLLDLEATIIHCPDCDNGYVRDKSCHCSPNPAGCPDCDYTGYLKTRCELCKGEGEVLMHNDGRIEVLI